MCIYHAIAKSNTLPLDNKETPGTLYSVIIICIVFLHILMIDILIRCSLKQKNNICLGTWKFCYICYFLLKQYFCAMLCAYAFKQLVGENEIDYHLSAHN